MRAKIKRCPFCNAHPRIIDCSQLSFWVTCLECGGCGPTGVTRQKAVRYWNTGYDNPSALVVNRKSNHHELKDVEF